MPNTDRNATPAHAAEVPRPALQIWQPLESEHIRWEGQVAIVGQEHDLPARLVITGKRLALIANNEIALEFPLGWMKPEPRLAAENGIRLHVSPDGQSQIAQPLLLRARAGRGAAIEIAAVLTGKPIASRSSDAPLHIPVWKDRVGAAPSVALPTLGDDHAARKPAPQKAAWPPVETTGVSQPKAPARPRPSADIAPWKVGSNVSTPGPVPSDMSRAQRLLGTGSDGFTISDNPSRPTPTPAQANQRKRKMPMWILNVAVIGVLLAGFAAAAVDRGYGVTDLRALVPTNVASLIGLDKNEADNTQKIAEAPDPAVDTTTDDDVTTGGDNRLLPVKNTTTTRAEAPTETLVAQTTDSKDIGGARQLPVTSSADDEGDADTETNPAATAEVVTDDTTDDSATTEADNETETTDEQPATEEADAQETATVETEPEATATVEADTDDTASEEAVAEPTFDPTAPKATEVATVLPTPEPTVAPTQVVQQEQPASVAEGTLPTQQFKSGSIRYSIDAVETGNTIASLPQINWIDGTWVVITITGANTSDHDAAFNMADFVLLADGNAVPLDTGTGWVSSLLGLEPAYGNTDTGTWAPGEQHQFSLTYRLPAGTTSMVLLAGDQQIDLSTSIATSGSLVDVPKDPAPAALVTGTVVEVLDGQTIVVDVNGELITVRYLGIDAPTGQACHSEQSLAANAELVEGKQVTLERQSSDTTARGLWLRDVWVTDDAGNQILVSQALVQNGAATSKVSQPNSRYESWLTTSQQDAENNGVGIWRLCGQE